MSDKKTLKDWEHELGGCLNDYGCFSDDPKPIIRRIRNEAFDEAFEKKQAINIIFDGPPGPESGRFVEVETDDGKSIRIGEWIERPDGLWALRVKFRELSDKLKHDVEGD